MATSLGEAAAADWSLTTLGVSWGWVILRVPHSPPFLFNDSKKKSTVPGPRVTESCAKCWAFQKQTRHGFCLLGPGVSFSHTGQKGCAEVGTAAALWASGRASSRRALSEPCH